MGISTIGAQSSVGAIDVGYGSCKGAFLDTRSGRGREIVLPAGAAVASAMPKLDGSRFDLKGGELVLVNGTPWVAGVDQSFIQGKARQTHAKYTETDEFYALALAMLARFGSEHIGLLVTGLPVNQYYGPGAEALRTNLQKRLTGRHHVSDQFSCDVAKVAVVPQPLGTFMGLASQPEYSQLATRDDLRTLVIDVGFGTTDSCLLSGKSVLDNSSSSTMLATSTVLKATAKRLSTKLDRGVTVDELDALLRRGSTKLPLGLSDSHDFREDVLEEASLIGKDVMATIMSDVRLAGDITVVILTGGGAWLFDEAAQKAFPKAEVIRPEDPVLSNALGYREIARLMTSRARAA